MNDFVYSILAWIQSWVGSWGWSIVVFAVLIRLVLTPLDFKSRVSMRKTQKLQPQLQALQKKYANDKEKLNAKTAELYKKEHINPLSSCLPLLLSWPVLIAVWGAMRMVANKELLIQLTQILNNEMPALEPWLWVKNLWMPDNLFSACLPDLNTLRVIPADQWQAWFSSLDQSNLPILIKDLGLTAASFDGNALQGTLQQILEAVQQNAAYVEAVAVRPGWTFNLLITQVSLINQYNGWLLLPILAAVSQFAMTKAMGGMQQQQPAGQGSAAGSGKFMQYFFPIFSLVICLGYSAAFSLYWVFSGLASMAQTIIINRWLDNKEQAAKAVAGEGSVK